MHKRYLPFLTIAILAGAMTPAYSLDSFMMPVSGTITSPYGMRWGRMHQGVDISAPVGTPVLAADDGVVAFVGQRRGYGNVVELHHSDGSITRYAHNSQNLVAVNTTVLQGQVIALVGCTGRCTGPHLHFEVIIPNIGAVDPLDYLQLTRANENDHNGL